MNSKIPLKLQGQIIIFKFVFQKKDKIIVMRFSLYTAISLVAF